MLTLSNLRSMRLAAGLKGPALARLSRIPVDRFNELEQNKSEPWHDEALILANIFNTGSIMTLVGVGDNSVATLRSMAGLTFPADLDTWRSGLRCPLSLALRITLRFGLRDPIELEALPVHRQIWEVMCASERNQDGPGWCPWCRADIIGGHPHTAMCLPANLWGPLDPALKAQIRSLPRVAKAGKLELGVKAKGLRAIRTAQRLKQEDMARVIGVVTNHYAKLERGACPLAPAKARLIADTFNVGLEEIYGEGVL